MNRVIKFYHTINGKCPIEEFLDSLPGKVVKKITWVLKLIEDLDVVPIKYLKKLHDTEEIWECRIQFGSDIYRIFCFFDNNTIVILTHGLIKKTTKTPKKEIEKAEHFRRDYLARRTI